MISGVERNIHFIAMDLPQSETPEAFCDGHVCAFDFFGGVPRSILHDNTKIAVAAMAGASAR